MGHFTTDEAYAAYARHVNPTLGRFLAMSGRDFRFVRARGHTLVDAGGRELDDWVAGFGSMNLGHDPAPIKAALREGLDDEAPSLFVEAASPFAGALAARLVEAAGPGFATAYLCSGGSEAVEAAIKAAALATGRPGIAYAAGGYHGTTLGALGCMARGVYRDPFEAMVPRFIEVPFGDAAAAEAALSGGEVAAMLLEPVQMEAGARVAPEGYLSALRAIADRHGALLIFDEVQTGMGRTGALFAFQRLGVRPDIFTLGKSLGGGLLPVAAAVMGGGVWERAYGSFLRSEIHNTTFGGYALGARAALAALAALGDPAFLAGVRSRGDRLFAELGGALSPLSVVERVSHLGLLGGVKLLRRLPPPLDWAGLGLPELAPYPSSGPLVIERLARHGIFAHVCAHDWSVVRVEPPLTVDDEACQRFVDAMSRSAQWLEESAGG